MPDATTERLRASADVWRDARGVPDADLAAQIELDAIDVLVDLGGHTSGNRLLSFARRPAPVQVTYCGYPGTTGLAAMDWRLTDAEADPASVGEASATERLWRLPNGFLCFRPDPDAPEPGPLPASVRGHVTFGSFNNLAKVNDGVLDVWAEILGAVAGARLLLKSRALSDPEPAARLRSHFADRGIDPARIAIAPYAATPTAHLALYQEVDIGLDPFPYNGTTTTCEALWMGVPVVSQVGRTHAGRVGASLLARVGLSELVTPSRAGYVRAAATLANNLAALAELRTALRPRVAASPLCAREIITRDIEAAFRGMWRAWCADRGVRSAEISGAGSAPRSGHGTG
jgi:predicted O-linked N-acetylglucosamine transferase (SPINDLY family)